MISKFIHSIDYLIHSDPKLAQVNINLTKLSNQIDTDAFVQAIYGILYNITNQIANIVNQ